MVRNNRGAHGVRWTGDRRCLEHGIESASLRALDFGGPGIAGCRSWMPAHVKHVDDALPRRLTVESLDYRDHFAQGGTALMKALKSLEKLVGFDFH